MLLTRKNMGLIDIFSIASFELKLAGMRSAGIRLLDGHEKVFVIETLYDRYPDLQDELYIHTDMTIESIIKAVIEHKDDFGNQERPFPLPIVVSFIDQAINSGVSSSDDSSNCGKITASVMKTLQGKANPDYVMSIAKRIVNGENVFHD